MSRVWRPIHQLGFGNELAIAVFGLVLVEQCYRRTPAASRWHVRPLLLGLGGLLAFDLVLYSDALLFGVLDVDLWAARGFAQAVTVPLMLLTLRRTRDWSFDLSISRGVLAGSTALLATGAYLVIMAGAGFLLREVGGSWGRALQSALVFAALLLLATVGLSATFRAKVRVLVAKNFFTYRYDYRAEWLQFTRTLTAGTAGSRGSPASGRWGISSKARAARYGCVDAHGQYRQVERSCSRGSCRRSRHDDPLPAFLGRTGWVLEICGRHVPECGSLRRAEAAGCDPCHARGLADRSPAERHESDRLRRADDPRDRDRDSTGRSVIC